MIPEMILYLLKVNLALILFYAGYHFILQRYTFYTINRFYLLIALVYSALYPFIDLAAILNQNEQLKDQINMLNWQGPVIYVLNQTENGAATYWQIALMIFWTGVIFMSLRLLIQLNSLLILHFQSQAYTSGNIKFRKITKAVNPFSFWRTIYLNPEYHEASEIQTILEHEHIHVKQLHTFDVMLAELSTIFYWFNPGIWLIKKAIKTNLEFITDQEVISSGIDCKEYQYTLLKSHALPQNSLPVNNFHFLTIKKRIAMINKKPSNRINLTNYLLLLPAIMLLVLIAGISRAEFTGKGVVEAITDLPLSPLPQIFNKEFEAEKDIAKNAENEPNTRIESQNAGLNSVLDTNKNIKVVVTNARKNQDDIVVKGYLNSDTTDKSQPLYVVDGKRMTTAKLDLKPEDIATVNVYKGESATTLYGAAGKNGVIEIRTKSASAGQSTDNSKSNVSVAYGSNQNQNISLTDIDAELLILDGKEITRADLDQVKVSSIGSIDILKGSAAVNKYGEKGKKGVIVITSK